MDPLAGLVNSRVPLRFMVPRSDLPISPNITSALRAWPLSGPHRTVATPRLLLGGRARWYCKAGI